MNTVILLILIIFICIFDYIIFNKSFISTPFIFTFPFVLALCDGLIYYRQWQFNLSQKTSILILAGILAVTFGSLFALPRYRIAVSDPTDLKRFHFKNSVYILFAFITIVCTLITIFYERKLVSSYGYACGSIQDIIGSYNELSKFGSTDVNLRGIGAYAYEITFSIGLLFSYLTARDISIAHRRFSRSCMFVYVLAAICVLTVGSRSVSITLLLSFVFLLLFFLQNSGQLRGIGSIKINTLLIVGIIVSIVPFVFLRSLALMGRETGSASSTLLYDFSIYLGAPLKNLDIAMNNGIPRSEMIGEWTFNNLYDTLKKIGFQGPEYSTDFGFQSINRWFLGNVYTIFYYLSKDYGCVGCCIALFVLGFLMQLVQSYCIKRFDDNKISVLTVMYGYFMYNVFFSFFADMTFQILFSTIFLKKLLLVGVFSYILNRRMKFDER